MICIVMAVLITGTVVIDKYNEVGFVSDASKAVFSETEKGELIIEANSTGKVSCEEQIRTGVSPTACASISNVKFNKLTVVKPTVKKEVVSVE